MEGHERAAKNLHEDVKQRERPRLLEVLGPGLITGASDDDPSGIATYSQVGAQFGYGLSWVMLFSWPLMSAIQEIGARIARVTGRGIAGNLKRHYPRGVAESIVLLLVIANVINIGADLGAMGASLKLLIGGLALFYVAAFGVVTVMLEIFSRYARYVSLLKWLTLSLFAYVGVVFGAHVPWGTVGYSLVVPQVTWSSTYLTSVVAILGTTISPYLFFWQAAEEVEEIKERVGARPLERPSIKLPPSSGASGWIPMWAWVCRTRGAVHYSDCCSHTPRSRRNRHPDICTGSGSAAPIAGQFAFSVYAIGIIGTGLLALPVLAGSSAYAVGETFAWHVGLARKPNRAKAFYGCIAAATLIGVLLNFSPLDPIKALFWSAVINGIVAVPVMALMMLLSDNAAVMGEFRLPRALRVVGWLSTAVMSAAAIALFATWGK